MTRIGVDTGGTFTDFVVLSGGRVSVHKVRSTPDDPSRAILAGLGDLSIVAGPGVDLVHGSTVATNAVLERKGARVALLATEGFEDVLAIGRQTRPRLYDWFVEPRRPLVDESLVFGVRERVDSTGAVLLSLDADGLAPLLAALGERGVEAVAVCFLHAYANPVHEARVAGLLEAAGFMVSASHRVLPEYREFERASTTTLNAYVTPKMSRYLGTLERDLGDARLRIMQSNGGIISAHAARQAAVRTILSGPAAGAVGALAVARAAGFARAVAFDMGGTSTDVTLLDDRLPMSAESGVGDFPMRLPVIDIHTVGAGGGSIAYVDSGGALRVGPESAGADPGPICYGRGERLTVTDANLLLGRLDPATFLGGRMGLDLARTRAAAELFAACVSLSPDALAEGIVRIANANMQRAIRVVTVQRGIDPRDFVLVAFGGAGGMHACEIAETLDMRTVLVPRFAGVLSALGMLLADVTRDYSRTWLREAGQVTDADIDAACAPLLAQAERDLASEGFSAGHRQVHRALDLRYVGQSFEITVPWQGDVVDAFHREHARLYGYADRGRPVEVVTLRVVGVGVAEKPLLPRAAQAPGHSPDPERRQPARFGGRTRQTAVYVVPALAPGATAPGPAILAGSEATTVVPPGWSFRLDNLSNIVITRTHGSRSNAMKGRRDHL